MTNILLQGEVADLVADLKEQVPEARFEISYQPYETEDADIPVHCPESISSERCDELSVYAAERSTDILLKEGFSILVLVFEPKERVEAENAAYRATLKQKAS